MIVIHNSSDATIEWSILKGASDIKVDFSSCPLKCLLISSSNKIPLEYEINDDGDISLTIPSGLDADVYALEALWITNPFRYEDSNIMSAELSRSRVDGVFSVTVSESEATNPGATIPIKVRSQVANYGKDGLSAYELAVLRGVTKSQMAWLDDLTCRYGVTAVRPSLGTNDKGTMYFDTTLGKPIWWNGTSWVNSNGTAV